MNKNPSISIKDFEAHTWEFARFFIFFLWPSPNKRSWLFSCDCQCRMRTSETRSEAGENLSFFLLLLESRIFLIDVRRIVGGLMIGWIRNLICVECYIGTTQFELKFNIFRNFLQWTWLDTSTSIERFRIWKHRHEHEHEKRSEIIIYYLYTYILIYLSQNFSHFLSIFDVVNHVK